MQTNLHQLVAKKIQNASCLIVTAGAGMGVDSGLPDFRGKEGFWKNYIPFRDKFSFTECANPRFLEEYQLIQIIKYINLSQQTKQPPQQTILSHDQQIIVYFFTKLKTSFGDFMDIDCIYTEIHNPIKAFKFQKHGVKIKKVLQSHQMLMVISKKQVKQIKPHILQILIKLLKFIISGFNDQSVFEVHGSINFMQCRSCQRIYSADGYNVIYDISTFEAKDPLPNCKNCVNVTVRPNILMFGDYSFMSDRVDEQEDRFLQFRNELTSEDKIVLLEFGAGQAVATIRMMGEQLFSTFKNIHFIRVNPRDYGPPFGWKEQKNSENKAFYALKEGALEAITQIQKYLI